jgi:hypothetical protein
MSKPPLFKHHHQQLKYFATHIHAGSGFCRSLIKVIEQSKSIVEMSFGFSIFDLQYILFCATPADIHIVVQILQGIQAIPADLISFLDPKAYLQTIDYLSFRCRAFPHKPSVQAGSQLWRKAGFNEPLNNVEHSPNPDFDRLWL